MNTKKLSLRNFLIVLLIFISYGILVSISSWVYYSGTDYIFNWGERFVKLFPSYILWAIILLVIYPFLLSNRPEKPNRLKNIVKVILFGIAVALIHRIVTVVVVQLLNGLFFNNPVNLYADLIEQKYSILAYTFDSFFMFIIIASVVYAIDYYRQSNKNKIKASQYETKLAQAELNSLRMQIQPHFLFNVLNSISTLIHKDPDEAEEMLISLSNLLRTSLDNTGNQFVELKTEIDFLESYLEIQRIRFKNRLTFTKNIDPQACDFPVPYLILQPLIENSIKHVLEKQKDSCIIKLDAELNSKYLKLNIEDNGPGIDLTEDVFSKGLGLSNVKARMEQIYKNDFYLELTNKNGLNINIKIPYKDG